MKILKFLIAVLCTVAMASCGGNTETATETETSQFENATIESIMNRRSIRKYKPQAVGRDTMMQIATCGIYAANGQNKQSWEVRIVDTPSRMEEIKELMVKGNTDLDAEMVKGCFRNAPVMAFIARAVSYDFSAYDCGLLAGNMMVAAQSLGVGSICLGSPVRFINNGVTTAEITNLLGFSEGFELSLCVGFGYAEEIPTAPERKPEKVQFID